MDTKQTPVEVDPNAQREADQRRAAAKAAAAERRRKLIALSPQFVEVIKLGQAFVRFTATSREDVFVWFEQYEGRAGCLHWEPLVVDDTSSTEQNKYTSLTQPKHASPENTLKFSAISDIYMGRSNAVVEVHSDVNTKLCLTFAAHTGIGDSLHLMARSRPQMEAWIYGIQYILKQGGFQFVEANEQADKQEQAIFENYTAKQLVRLIMKGDDAVKPLRLQATLTQMNRGQVFLRFLPDGSTENVYVFFCSDGGKGTVFWGQRAKPDGYLPLRTVTDMWLGKHGLITDQVCMEDAAQCMSLASKKALLAIQAPSKAIMTQWVYGIHCLLTASPETLMEINKNHPKADPAATAAAATATSEEKITEAEKAVTAQQAEAAGSNSVDGEEAFRLEAAAALNALKNLAISQGTDDLWNFGDVDMTLIDSATLAKADAVESEANKVRAEFEAAMEARKAADTAKNAAKKEEETAAMAAADTATEAAESVLAMVRALRESASNRTQEAMEHLMSMTEQAIGDDDDDDDNNDNNEEESAVNTSKDTSMVEEAVAEPTPKPARHGRRLSIFSSLELDDDVRNLLSFAQTDEPTINTENVTYSDVASPMAPAVAPETQEQTEEIEEIEETATEEVPTEDTEVTLPTPTPVSNADFESQLPKPRAVARKEPAVATTPVTARKSAATSLSTAKPATTATTKPVMGVKTPDVTKRPVSRLNTTGTATSSSTKTTGPTTPSGSMSGLRKPLVSSSSKANLTIHLEEGSSTPRGSRLATTSTTVPTSSSRTKSSSTVATSRPTTATTKSSSTVAPPSSRVGVSSTTKTTVTTTVKSTTTPGAATKTTPKSSSTTVPTKSTSTIGATKSTSTIGATKSSSTVKK